MRYCKKTCPSKFRRTFPAIPTIGLIICLFIAAIMKNYFPAIVALIVICITTSSFAAQDQALIRETRKNQLAHDAKETSVSPTQAAAIRKAVLPLDHDPRAVGTPWENQQRALHVQEQDGTPLSEKGN
jgi:hypothetical protein